MCLPLEMRKGSGGKYQKEQPMYQKPQVVRRQ